jgi:hypothetical protein
MSEAALKLMAVQIALGALLVSLVAMLLSYASARFNIRNKQIDVIFQDHKRFDELQVARAQILVAEADRRRDQQSGWSEDRLRIDMKSSQSKHVNDFLRMMEYLRDNKTVDMKSVLRKFGPTRVRGIFRWPFAGS